MSTIKEKQKWYHVAIYDGKKVKKQFTTMKEFVDIDWISETKFSFHDDSKYYREGIVLAEADDEKSLRDMISKKPTRVPHNTFKPFPDMNVKSTSMLGKWKKRLTTIAMNDSSIRKAFPPKLSEEKFVHAHLSEQPSVDVRNNKVETELANVTNQEINCMMDLPENKQLPEKESSSSVIHQPINKPLSEIRLLNSVVNQPNIKHLPEKELSSPIVDQLNDQPMPEQKSLNSITLQSNNEPLQEKKLLTLVGDQPNNKPLSRKELLSSVVHKPKDDYRQQAIHEELQSLGRGKLFSKMSNAGIRLSTSSQNVADYIMNKRRIAAFSDSDEDSMHPAFVICPNESKKAEKFPLVGGMVSKKKYVKLRQKYNFLKGMFHEQKQQYAKDLKIQYFAQCLSEAIKNRYSSDDEEKEEE